MGFVMKENEDHSIDTGKHNWESFCALCVDRSVGLEKSLTI